MAIPVLLVVSWRGYGGQDAPEHLIMGEKTPEILHTLGERGEAAATLGGAIEDQGDPKRPDPARVYYLGDRAEQKQLLEAVKATVSGLPESQ